MGKLGIDISEWNTNLTYSYFKLAGVEYAIPREGCRTRADKQFFNHVTGLKTVGIDIPGVYHFVYAWTREGVEQEASSCIANVVKAGLPKTTRIWCDVEYDTVDDAKEKGVTLGASDIRNITKWFCDAIESAGYPTGVYTNYDYYKNYYGASFLEPYELWFADYGRDNPRVECAYHQYTSSGRFTGLSDDFDCDYFLGFKKTANTESKETANTMSNDELIIAVRKAAVEYAVGIADDNSHGYSQTVRSLLNITNPKSYDCSSLVITSYYYAFKKYGLETQATYLKNNCSYTGNMMKMLNCGFEIVARNQTACSQAVIGDIELSTAYHTALYIGSGQIVHARSSEGTNNTIDDSGNEIRTQAWYLRSGGWDYRLRFTGNGVDFSKCNTDTTSATMTGGIDYMFSVAEISKGSTGNDVKLLQKLLRVNNYKGSDNNVLDLDGEFGSNTDYAVKNFQTKNSLEVDGVCGPNTWKAILMR